MKNFRSIIFIVGIAFFIGLIYMSMKTGNPAKPAEPQQEDPSATGVAENILAPDFTLQDINGKTVKLSDFRGQVVFLNFWATWCSACKSEMPAIQQVFTEQGSKIKILAVNVEETGPQAQAYLKQYGLSFPALLDTDGKVSNLYQIRYLPTSYFIDKNGKIVKKYIGAMNKSQMEEFIKLAGG